MKDSPAPPASRAGLKFVIGGSVIVVALIALMVWAMNRESATAFYMTPTEIQAMGATDATRDYRVNGTVVPGTIERDGLETTFVITDGDTEITVATESSLPDTFKERSDVVARGDFDGDTFTAYEVLAKCPSKFKAKA